MLANKFVSLISIFLFYTQIAAAMTQENFRNYDDAQTRVKEFYYAQHKHQTYDFVRSQIEPLQRAISSISRARSGNELQNLQSQNKIKLFSISQALRELDNLIDESDPDTSLPNSIHALQTAEAIRGDLEELALSLGVPLESIDWFILVGLLHDMGKIDALLRKIPQWAVVGDTFPLGCRFSQDNIFYEAFEPNPDHHHKIYSSEQGVYKKNIGLTNLVMAYGHDEYAYQVFSTQSTLPKEALAIIRFHSFYPLHQKNAYRDLLSEDDQTQLVWIRRFQKYDLYSKRDDVPNWMELQEFYKKLINKYFVPKDGDEELLIAWPILEDISTL